MPPDADAKKEFYGLATRYLLDEASGEEREQLVTLLKEPSWQGMFEQMSAGWNASAANWMQGFEVEQEIEKVVDAISEDRLAQPALGGPLPPIGNDPVQHIPPRRVFWRWPAIAAAVAIVTALGFHTHTVRSQQANRGANIPNGTWVKQISGVGERREVTLDDGSRVSLNAGSKLSFPNVFGTHSRVVRLTGEAYFDVTRDVSRPFIVETPTLRITVLGTQFNVKAFTDGSKAQVTLLRGKVRVTPLETKTEQSPVILTPGTRYSVDLETGSGDVQLIPTQISTGWMSDKIVWNQEPLPDAMRELERRYGISIELNDPGLLTETVTARFQSETVREIFQLLHAARGVDYRLEERDGRVERVTLSPSSNRPNSTGTKSP